MPRSSSSKSSMHLPPSAAERDTRPQSVTGACAVGSVHAGGGVTLNLESPATGGSNSPATGGLLPGGGVSRSGGGRGGGKTPQTPQMLATQLGAGKESSRWGGHAVCVGWGGGDSRVIQMLHSEAFAAGGPLSARKRRAGWLKVPLFFF
jgi:hypothetical protein